MTGKHIQTDKRHTHTQQQHQQTEHLHCGLALPSDSAAAPVFSCQFFDQHKSSDSDYTDPDTGNNINLDMNNRLNQPLTIILTQ